MSVFSSPVGEDGFVSFDLAGCECQQIVCFPKCYLCFFNVLERLVCIDYYITFLIGNPYKPSFPLLLGGGTTQCIDKNMAYILGIPTFTSHWETVSIPTTSRWESDVFFGDLRGCLVTSHKMGLPKKCVVS